jgi:hypothetical protein
MDLRSPVNIVTRREIYPDLIDDFWFTESALFARMRDKIVPFSGGTFTSSVFRFRPLIATHYKMGATHNITKVQTLADSAFDMKFAQSSIPEFKEELEVYAKGENAVFSLLDEDLENGLASVTDAISFALWGEGQTDDSMPNGLAEMIGDGVLPNWNGYVATSYGGVTRNGDVGAAINGNIVWGGTATGKVGDINFPLMNYTYQLCSKGAEEPDLIIANRLGHTYMWNKMEPQYRYVESVQDPYWGGSGFRFRNAYVMVDEHAPSSAGLSDANNYGLGNYLTGTINPNPVTTTKNFFPVVGNAATLDVGEVIFFLNTNRMVMRISDSAEYGFGFSGFMGTPDSEKVVGRIKVAYNFEGLGSRYQGVLFGIGG